jgi:hypothetical protein
MPCVPRLLPIVAAVAESEATGVDLVLTSGLDHLDLFHHVAVATEAGLVVAVSPGRYRVTARGFAWAERALEPFGHLIERVRDERPSGCAAVRR